MIAKIADSPGGTGFAAILRRPFFWIMAAIVATFVIAPSIGADVQLREDLLLAAVYMTLASNINLILGYAGYVNFGSIVFFGLGGYFTIYFMSALGWNLVVAALFGGLAVSALAYAFGLGILRLRGAYFALATIGVNEAVQAFVTNFTPWGGGTGIYLSTELFMPLGGPTKALWVIYYALVGVMGLSLYLSWFIKISKFGLGPAGDRRERGCRRRARRADAALQGDGLLRLGVLAGDCRRALFLQGRFHPADRRLRSQFIDRGDRHRSCWAARAPCSVPRSAPSSMRSCAAGC